MKTYFNFLSRVRRCTPRLAGILIASLFFTAATADSWSAAVEAKPATQAKPAAHHPNILLIVLDDVGIDQMSSFGYGGATAPRMPNVDAIANAGVRFRNFWTMPECSPSRALMFEGRFPLRTNVYDAILSVDLANSQVSPYETTTPKLLKQAGYINGLFGKFH
ncbi:MAG: sulfatase-like hydrolase/transferase, partial [Betaproteobacteria bacterium]